MTLPDSSLRSQNGFHPGSQELSPLEQFSQTTLARQARPSAAQAQLDGVVSGFVDQASDWRALASMMAGGVAFRLGRSGVLSLSTARQAFPALNLLSQGVGLATEVTVFEASHRGLQYFTGERSNSNLLRWSGSGGFWEGWRASFVNFGLLKLGGAAAEGQNLVFQHLLQDTAMVAGNHLTAQVGFTPAPEGSLAQQFFHAEATNIQLAVSMGFAHAWLPSVRVFEQGLHLSLEARQPSFEIPSRELPSPALLEHAFAMAMTPKNASEAQDAFVSSSSSHAMSAVQWGRAGQEEADRTLTGEQPISGGISPPDPTSLVSEEPEVPMPSLQVVGEATAASERGEVSVSFPSSPGDQVSFSAQDAWADGSPQGARALLRTFLDSSAGRSIRLKENGPRVYREEEFEPLFEELKSLPREAAARRIADFIWEKVAVQEDMEITSLVQAQQMLPGLPIRSLQELTRIARERRLNNVTLLNTKEVTENLEGIANRADRRRMARAMPKVTLGTFLQGLLRRAVPPVKVVGVSPRPIPRVAGSERVSLPEMMKDRADLPLARIESYLLASPEQRREMVTPTFEELRAVQTRLNAFTDRFFRDSRNELLRRVENCLCEPTPSEVENFLRLSLPFSENAERVFAALSSRAREGLYLLATALEARRAREPKDPNRPEDLRTYLVQFLDNPFAHQYFGGVEAVLGRVVHLHDRGVLGYESAFIPRGKDSKFLSQEDQRIHSMMAEYDHALRLAANPEVEEVRLAHRLTIDWEAQPAEQKSALQTHVLLWQRVDHERKKVEVDVYYRMRDGRERIAEVKSYQGRTYQPEEEEASKNYLQAFRLALLIAQHRFERLEYFFDADYVDDSVVYSLRRILNSTKVNYVLFGNERPERRRFFLLERFPETGGWRAASPERSRPLPPL